jgi:hypothetical protein
MPGLLHCDEHQHEGAGTWECDMGPSKVGQRETGQPSYHATGQASGHNVLCSSLPLQGQIRHAHSIYPPNYEPRPLGTQQHN